MDRHTSATPDRQPAAPPQSHFFYPKVTASESRLTTHTTGPRVEHWQNNEKLDREAPLIVRRRPVQLEAYSQPFFNINSSILYA